MLRETERFEDTKGVIRRTGNAITKWKTTKGQTTIYKILHRKLKQLSNKIPTKTGNELLQKD